MIVERHQQSSIEYSSVDIIPKDNEQTHEIHRGNEVERKEIEPYPFSTKVKYLYTFQEVAFLIYKLSKMLKTRTKLMPKRYEVKTQKEKKLSFKELVRSTRKTTLFDLEKISSLQDRELNAASKRSLQNKNRWTLLKNKVTNPNFGSENEDVEKLKANIMEDITIFLSNEVGSLPKKKNKHSKSNDHIKNVISKTLINEVNTAATATEVDTATEGEEDKEHVDVEDSDKVIIKKKRQIDPLKETTIVNIKKKDALGKPFSHVLSFFF